jgi:hypothetical protein
MAQTTQGRQGLQPRAPHRERTFPASDKAKYMLMLNSYMDETGHSKDERQRFNGIAGLFAPSENWEVFEAKWKATLDEFKVPFFHMKDFEARDFGGSKSPYKGWNEAKRRRLFGKLMRHIAGVQPIITGSIIPMEYYRELTESQRAIHGDPYFLSFQNVIAYCTSFLEVTQAPPGAKVALIFSDQVEFRHRALKLYENIYEVGKFIKRSAKPPSFEDMREVVPLQAADIVAYEMYKEADRRMYRPNDKVRFGYQELAKMNLRHGYQVMCRFYSKAELTEYYRNAERTARMYAYWKNKRKLKDAS